MGNNKKISEVLYKIEHNSLPGVVVHGDNFIIQREKKLIGLMEDFRRKIAYITTKFRVFFFKILTIKIEKNVKILNQDLRQTQNRSRAPNYDRVRTPNYDRVRMPN